MSKSGFQDANRREALGLWSKSKQKGVEVLSGKEKERRAEAAKTARLRELRLAKEAADAAAAPTPIRARRKAAKPESQ